jgi:HK97 family phage major capsid protein
MKQQNITRSPITQPRLRPGPLDSLVRAERSSVWSNIRNLPMTPRMAKEEYSLRRLILEGEKLHRDGGVELEISKVISKQIGQESNGFFVPTEILTRDIAATTGTGANLIGTEVVPDIADALRPYAATLAAGATVLNDLTSSVSWPRYATPSSPSGLAENTTVVHGTTATFSAMSLQPKRISTEVWISRQLLVTASMDFEKLVQKEILRSLARAIDFYALNGSGAPYPTGLLSLPENSVGQYDLSKLNAGTTMGGAATFSKLVAMTETLHPANIVDDGTCAWIIDGATSLKWKTAQKVSGYPSYLLEDNEAADYPVFVSQNLSGTHQAVFGRWSDLIIGLWGVSILSDVYSQLSTGTIRFDS